MQKQYRHYTLDPYFSGFKGEVNDLDIDQADLVIGFFLLDHARNKKELRVVIENCKHLLKKGGRFIGMVDNLDITLPTPSGYGVMVDAVNGQPLVEGSPRRISICENQKEVLHFNNYAWSKGTLQKLFDDGGFRGFTYRNAEVSPEFKKEYPDGFWSAYENDPTQGVIIAQK